MYTLVLINRYNKLFIVRNHQTCTRQIKLNEEYFAYNITSQCPTQMFFLKKYVLNNFER